MDIVDLFRTKSGRNGFHNIMPMENIPSVIKNGILSNELAVKIQHSSIAMNEVQSIRDKIQVPGGLMLHQYANLYFDSRNPMMYKRKNEDICVLKISDSVLELDDVIISDMNASSQYARFYEPYVGIEKLDYTMIYAESWADNDQIYYLRKKASKCAEVLVPYKVPYEYIISAAVKNETDKQKLIELGFDKTIRVIPKIFFK